MKPPVPFFAAPIGCDDSITVIQVTKRSVRHSVVHATEAPMLRLAWSEGNYTNPGRLTDFRRPALEKPHG